MKAHELRVVKEREDLSAKIDKLDKFIKTRKAFGDLKVMDQELLITQLDSMRAYSQILKMRISRF